MNDVSERDLSLTLYKICALLEMVCIEICGNDMHREALNTAITRYESDRVTNR